MLNNVSEEWRDVVGYEGLYKISSHGRVKSYHARYKKPRILKTSMTTTGYKKVELAAEYKITEEDGSELQEPVETNEGSGHDDFDRFIKKMLGL